jgi:hypothetical protein
MKRVANTPSHLVFDDVLDADEFDEVVGYMSREKYVDVHSSREGHRRVFTVADGRPLSGPVAIASVRGTPAPEPEQGVHLYPTGAPIDIVIKKVLASARRCEAVVGRKGEDWERLVARSWLYPPHTGLGWHDDTMCTGAFVFYAHPTWSLDWGGELLLIERPSGQKATRAGAETSLGTASALRGPKPMPEGSGGRFVTAKPNRLVVLAAGTTHRIAPVSPLAGHHVRATISGFFFKPS